MATFEDFVDIVHDETRDGFVRRYQHPFLLLELEPESSESKDWSFKTVTIASRKIKLARIFEGQGAVLSEEAANFRVFSVVKSAGNPWQERISVGRARNNDIVLPHNSVSKLHAHFTKEDHSLRITDAGSRNGTRINKTKLRAARPTPIGPGDVVTFGGLSLTLLSAGDLYDLINMHIRPRGPQN